MKTYIYQICYSPETLENIPEGFKVLDNLKNERPDWREFWAIRQFLKSNYLADDALYGFMSPKFPEKTGLNYKKYKALSMTTTKAKRLSVLAHFGIKSVSLKMYLNKATFIIQA